MKKLRTFALVAAFGCAAGAIAALVVTSRNKGQTVLQTAQDAVGNLTGAAKSAQPADEMNPELRQKIEEARARIAAQVAKNAAADGAGA